MADFLKGIQTGSQLASVRMANELKQQQLLEAQERISQVKQQTDARAMEATFGMIERIGKHPGKTRAKLVDTLRPQMEKLVPGAPEDFYLMLKDEEGAAQLQSAINKFNELKAINPEAALQFAATARGEMGGFEASQMDLLVSNLSESVKFSQKKQLEAFKQEQIGRREVAVEGAKESVRARIKADDREFQKELVGIKGKERKLEKLSDRTRQIEDKFQDSNSKILSFRNLIGSKPIGKFTPADDFSLMFQFISMLDDSVVRGNEIGTFNQGFGILDRFKNEFRRIIGGGRFNDKVRSMMIDSMKGNISGILQNQKSSLLSVQRGTKVAGGELGNVITNPCQRKIVETKDLKSLFQSVRGKKQEGGAPTGTKEQAEAILQRLEDPRIREAALSGQPAAPPAPPSPPARGKKSLPDLGVF